MILVKALPQPSATYGETVCCAGVTLDRRWKRLFPIRFRRLEGKAAFNRWDLVTYRYRRPTADPREESCHVFEDTISVTGKLSDGERARLLNPMIMGSGKAAAAAGRSLTLVRPLKSRFVHRPKSQEQVSREREAFAYAARQDGMFDKRIAQITPTPYTFRFEFEDEAGAHAYQSGDWETHATFFNHRRRTSEVEALRFLDETYNVTFPEKGMAFVLGNMAKRPQVWQLLGVIRLDLPSAQADMFS